MNRKYNFYAGPATLPLPVLEQLQEQMVEYPGLGMSLVETSHRTKDYDEVHNQAITLVKELLGLGDQYKVLFLGGGATLQFSMIPLNFLHGGKSCDFIVSGTWSKKALADAKKVGTANVLWDGTDSKFTTLPAGSSIQVSKDAEYLHMTSNETIQGVQWMEVPACGDVPIVCDMSSDIMSRPLPLDSFGMIYAGAQKNLGPSGLALVIIRDDMLAKCPEGLTAYLDYNIHASKNSLYNTPPVFPIWAVKLVLEWIKGLGGLEAMENLAHKKSGLLYDTIDGSGGFYKCPVEPAVRSMMNVVFTLPSDELSAAFLAEAPEHGLVGLKGHRSIGGCRASIYNAMPVEGVETLASFMKDFAAKNG